MVKTASRLAMTDSEREEQKKMIKKRLSREESKAEDADSRLGEPYVTEEVKLDEIATSTER